MKFYVFCFANLLEIYKFSTSGEIVTSCNISPLSVTDRGEIGMTFQVRAGVSCLFCGVGMVVGVDVCICVVVCVCVCVRGAVGVRGWGMRGYAAMATPLVASSRLEILRFFTESWARSSSF